MAALNVLLRALLIVLWFAVANSSEVHALIAKNRIWSKFDPLGLSEKTKADVTPTRDKHHLSPVSTWDENGFSADVQKELDKHRVGKEGVPHSSAAHNQYNKRADAITKGYMAKSGVKNPSALTGKEAREFAEGLIKEIRGTADDYVKGFNALAEGGASQADLAKWGRQYKANVIAGRVKDVWFKGGGRFLTKGSQVISGAKAAFNRAGRVFPGILRGITFVDAYGEFSDDVEAGEPMYEAARTQYYRYSSLTGETPEEREANDKNRSEGLSNWLIHGSWQTDAERQGE